MSNSDGRLFGYCDRISVRGGDTIRFMVSAEAIQRVNAQVVRVIHGDEHPEGPGFIEVPVAAEVNGSLRVSKQFTQVGSFARIRDSAGLLRLNGPLTLYAYIWPTTPKLHDQVILGRWDSTRKSGYALAIDEEGYPEFRMGDGSRVARVRGSTPLIGRCWYLIAASLDPRTGNVTVHQRGMVSSYNSLLSPALACDYGGTSQRRVDLSPRNDPETEFLLAGCNVSGPDGKRAVGELYNGKIDRCGIVSRVLEGDEIGALASDVERGELLERTVAHWDPTVGYGPSGIDDIIRDVGPHQLHAYGHNRPVRGMTGVNWRGREDSYRMAPGEYGGVHFHEDALIDCHWEPSCSWKVPADLRSGCYALKLSGGDLEEYIPFFLRASKPTAKIAVLIPVTSYLAYANEQLSFNSPVVQPIFGRTPILSEADFVRVERPELGLSTYDTHLDGAGVCFSSYHRPILNMRPKYRLAIGSPWQYPADLSIIGWLESKGYEYEVLCDEDLHREGDAALSPYRLVITGSHPESFTERMLDAIEGYLGKGGRLVYTGGNGFYWVSSYRESEPWCMEVRKLDSGSRAWQAMPGEHYNQTEAVRSGLWRNRGRAPQKLVGVGFASEGFDVSGAYTKLSDARDPALAWIFEGVPEETFGGFGLALGGSAGLELDRYDRLLGTPPTARLLATAQGPTDNYPRVSEEIYYNFPGQGASQDYQCRADLVYFTTKGGGAVFSTGSIAWASALPVNKFDNTVSWIMANVVEAFVDRETLPE